MSNTALKTTRDALVRLTLGTFLCLPLALGATARPAQDGPKFFSLAAVLGGETVKPAKTIDRTAPFKAFGYQLFASDMNEAAGKWAKTEAEMARDLALIESCAETPRECTAPARAAYALIAQARLMPAAGKVTLINSRVNAAVRYTADFAQHGVADLWSSPLMTLGAKGDCEDYAIAKYALLKASGMDMQDIRIVLVRDNAVREDHAIMAVRLGKGWSLLDNRHNRIEAEREVTHYRPLISLSQDKAELYAAPLVLNLEDEAD